MSLRQGTQEIEELRVERVSLARDAIGKQGGAAARCMGGWERDGRPMGDTELSDVSFSLSTSLDSNTR
jgi:hypothetical protein